jgi:hypothetical protein
MCEGPVLWPSSEHLKVVPAGDDVVVAGVLEPTHGEEGSMEGEWIEGQMQEGWCSPSIWNPQEQI